jgi:hypothetical protein
VHPMCPQWIGPARYRQSAGPPHDETQMSKASKLQVMNNNEQRKTTADPLNGQGEGVVRRDAHLCERVPITAKKREHAA